MTFRDVQIGKVFTIWEKGRRQTAVKFNEHSAVILGPGTIVEYAGRHLRAARGSITARICA